MVATISPSMNPNAYDPISNLEKQKVPKVPVILRINNACFVQGGVDALMKSAKGRQANMENMESVIEDSLEDLNISDNGNANGNQAAPESNPFGFLNDDLNVSNSSMSTSTHSSSRSSRPKGNGKFARFGAKLKNQFDRGVTSMAVQAQKATGDSTEIRDLLTIGAYIQNSETGEFNECIGMTERVEMPIDPEGTGLTFCVPILIPMDAIQSSSANPGALVQFYLWMRSGAAIFQKNRALRKYLFVGCSTLRLAQLARQMQPKFDRPIVMKMPLQSTAVVSGEMVATFISDTKFPNLCGNGWSLTDPRSDTAYSNSGGKRIIHNIPLEQNYAYAVPNQHMTPSTNITILATERLTESTVVLPLATAWTRLISAAAAKSASHTMDMVKKLQYLDGVDTVNPMTAMQQGHAQCQIDVYHFLRYSNATSLSTGGGSIQLSFHIQRADSIFENCIASSCTVPSHAYVQNTNFPLHSAAASIPFYPRIVKRDDPRLLPGQTMGPEGSKRDVFVGKVRIQLYEEGVGGSAGGDLFSPLGPAGAVGTNPRSLEALIDIDSHLNEPEDKGVFYLNVVDLVTGQVAGTLAIGLRAQTLEGMVENSKGINGSTESGTVKGGLISLVGMDTLMEDDKACYPHSDLNESSAAKVLANSSQTEGNESIRLRQLATMGEFLTCDYMVRHAEEKRDRDKKDFAEKAERYFSALNSPIVEGEEMLLPNKQKEPRPFRASSSRMDSLLSAIGFNIHIQGFSISAIVAGSSGDVVNVPKTLFQNVTCGAPAAHERGFSKTGEKDNGFSGGLRRLEESRLNLAEDLRKSQDCLIEAVGNYYRSNTQSIPGRSLRHIPAGEHKVASLRAECISLTQTLHNLTWEIASRRSTVFSQALGIGVSMYLAHVSDLAKLQKAAWAELWQKHGFLITFEGLLSAAGKELGMIEDASVGIAMLRMVSVVFVTETNQVNPGASGSRVPIKDSPYLMWLRINTHGEGLMKRYLVELCVDANYYAQRIPPPLQNLNRIRFYPVLYQMGVDIRQWGANAGANFGKSKNEGNEEMDEDEVGVPDNDVLLSLNYEAFRKMNAYAHEVFLVADPQKRLSISWENAHVAQQIQQPIHPMLTALYEYIRSSAGKMEHGILDEAGFASNRLGGGSAIFCKSGKDRTAMQVTFKQSQFIDRYLKSNGNGFSECELDLRKMFSNATTMRVYGTRLPICDKNVGQALYAFNALQARFMPDLLKPPARALAGFLKGGRVFSGEAIES